MFELRGRTQFYFLWFSDMDESISHPLLQFRYLVDLQLEDFVVIGGEEAVDMFLEGDSLGNHQDLIFFCGETDEKRGAISGRINGIGLILVDDHQAPLRLLPCLGLKLLQSFKQRFPLSPLHSQELNNNFGIGAAGEFDIAEVLIFNGGVVGDDAVMDQVDLMRFIEVRMGVAVYFLAAGCPAGVGDAASGHSCLLHDFLNHLVYAAGLFQAMLGVFDESACLGGRGVGEDTGTIIASILEQLYTLTQKLFQAVSIVIFGHLSLLLFSDGGFHHHPHNTAAFLLLLFNQQPSAEQPSYQHSSNHPQINLINMVNLPLPSHFLSRRPSKSCKSDPVPCSLDSPFWIQLPCLILSLRWGVLYNTPNVRCMVLVLSISYNRMDSGPGDMKTQSKRQVQKMEVCFEDKIFSSRKFKLKFFPWIRTAELKKILVKEKFNDKHTHLTEGDIRLFCKNMELTEEKRSFFDFYKIDAGSTIVIMANANAHNLQNGVINPYQIFEKTPQEITNLVLNVQSGLNAGKRPKLAAEGTSGTYFLENNQKKVVAVYKPFDEEPYTPNNPRGFAGELGGEGIRKGVLSGQCATREVAAYLLDSMKHFHQVPATAYVEFYHPCFSYREVCENPIVSHPQCDLKKLRTKHGSLQEFVEYMDIVGNLGARQFDINQVHKIAILDLRILNCDRNQANILVVKKLVSNSKGATSRLTSLIPIDHGLSFPDNFEIYDHQIVWMGYKQTQMPLSQQSLDFIDSIDPLRDCTTLREKLGFREICLRNFRVAQIFLKRLARAGFTLHEIGKFVYREDDEDWSGSQQQQPKEKKPILSELQRLVKEAEVIYFTVKDNGIKSTVEFQIGLIRLRREEQEKEEVKEVTSQEENLQLGALLKKMSSKHRETSIQKQQQNPSPPKSKHKVRNISLPNLKRKPSNIRDKRMRLKKRKNAHDKKGQAKDKSQNWGEVFFHYFQEILERFVKRKLEIKKNKPVPKPARGRLFSENIEL